MQTLQTRMPSAVLRPFVRAFAQRRIDANDAVVQQACPARLEPVLEFQFQDTYQVSHSDGRVHAAPHLVIVGGFLHSTELTFRKTIESFGTFFHPTGLSRLFGIPIHELFHRFYDASSVLGRQIEVLRGQLAEAISFDQRVRLTETFLYEQLARATPEESMWRIADYIFAQKGLVRVADTARLHGFSIRQFERTFQQQIGTTPKQYARVARFQSALDARTASPHLSWLYIAHELGYHDQTHMVRDFHEFAGCTPGLLLPQIGYARPEGLVSLGV